VDLLARIISVLVHPLLMGTYLCALLMLIFPAALEPVRPENYPGFLMLIFLVTFLLPAINLFIFKLFGSIPSLSMPERRDRYVPFVFISLYLFYWKFGIDYNDNIFRFLLIMDFLVVGATLLTFFYRVSVHSLAVCGLLGIFVPLNKASEGSALLYATSACLLVAGAVMSARLQLNAHTPREILVGGVSGFIIGFVSMIVMF
jgi:membrane-associated phospholipid phosphatase